MIAAGHRHPPIVTQHLTTKATSEELDDYRRLVLTLANKVAAAHREDGRA
jgi:hypothetical protein